VRDRLFSIAYLESYLSGNEPRGESPIGTKLAKQLADTMRDNERLKAIERAAIILTTDKYRHEDDEKFWENLSNLEDELRNKQPVDMQYVP